jgi:hypothetical protein
MIPSRVGRAQDDATAPLTVQAPAAVKATLQEEIGDGRVNEISSQADKDDAEKRTYTIKATVHGDDYTLKIEDDGELISDDIDSEDPPSHKVAVSDVPAAAQDALKKAGGPGAVGGDITAQDYQQVFETHVRLGAHAYDIRVDNAGRLLTKEEDDTDEPSGKTAA